MRPLDISDYGITVFTCAAHIDARPVADPVTHFVIVRRDLPLGVIAAMLVHAAGESSTGNLAEGTYAIALQVADEAALIGLLLRLQRHGVAVTPVNEPDEPYNGQLMAIGVRPARRSEVARFLSDIPLFKDSSGSFKRGQRESVTVV